jgi:MoxR-like ATPase
VFDSIERTIELLAAQRYICDRKLATVTFLAHKMQKPVLIEGPAGVGKTELAKAVAQALGRKLLRLQCYAGLDETHALYEWEYGKQLLYTQVLRDKISAVFADVDDLRGAVEKLRRHEDLFFSENFLVRRPILQAISAAESTVLLIDELDRAEEQFEAFLLEVLSDFQVTIPEIGTIACKAPPTVIITSNNTRDLSDALKRRCLHLFIDYPNEARELEIVRLKVPEVSEALAAQVVNVIRRMRAMDLRKAPSISETLDWTRALVLLNADHLTHELLEETLELVVKYERDTQEVRDKAEWLLEGLSERSVGQDHKDHQDDRAPAAAREAGVPRHVHEEQVLPPPRQPAAPEQKDVERRKREHTARYFGADRLRMNDGNEGAA